MITLFNILISQKRGISVKEKQTTQPGNVRESYTHQNTQIHAQRKKRKIFFIPTKVQLITINSVIPYISKINSTSSSLKKKKKIKRGRESANEKGKEKEKEKKGIGKDKERKRD